MGHKWKRRRSSSLTDTGVDLLSTAFGMPSHWDIKRADRKLSSRGVYQYGNNSDETIDSILEQESEDACTRYDTTPSNRNTIPIIKTSFSNSSSRKRQQSHGQISPTVRQRNITSKSTKSPLLVKIVSKEKKSGQSPSQSEKKSKTLKPASPGGLFPGLNKSRNVPENNGRNYATFSPFHMTNPVLWSTQPDSSTHSHIPHSEARFVTQMPQYPSNAVHIPAHLPVFQAISRNSDERHSTLPNSQTQKLQSLQQHLNNAQDRLSKNPDDSRLRRDQSEAQRLLNKFLDVLVAEKSPSKFSTPKTKMGEVSAKKSLPLKKDAKENVAPKEESTKPGTGMSFLHQQQGDQTLRLAILRDITQANTIRHHLCSGCGEVRSQQFHANHPIGIAHKHILNYCSACRDIRFKKDMMDRHHFCFGCGRVRSKVFQEKYKAEPGEPLLPNYCGRCTNEVRSIEGINEASVLGTVIRKSESEVDQEASIATVTSSAASKGGSSSRRANNQAPQKSLKAKNVAQLRLNNAPPTKNMSAPVSPAESSPFYPGRRLGSAQRRAQRGSTPHPGEEHVAASESLAELHEYHVPYVEEMFSDTESSEPAINLKNTEAPDSRDESIQQDETRSEESDRADATSNGQNFTSCETPEPDNYHASSFGTSNSSSGGRTVKARPPREAGYDSLEFRSEQSLSSSPRGVPADKKEYADSTGAFGKGNGLDQAIFEISNEKMSRRPSPLAEFESSNNPSYFHDDDSRHVARQDNTDEPEKNQFPSSRGAFGRKESCFSIFDYSSAGAGRSQSKSSDGSSGHNGCEDQYSSHAGVKKSASSNHDGSGDSSFSSSSSSSKENSNRDEPSAENTYSRLLFTDYSRSTNNPYYKPRRHQYPGPSEGAFHRSWEWSKKNQVPETTNAYGNAKFDGWIPEPIIEEPASPPSTPVQRTMLLEFRALEKLESSLPSELRDRISAQDKINVNGLAFPISHPDSPA
ncbi:hypothetical protein C2857_004235 [Epichloe festucae Fl1]|uniref:Uncharacterized protein n=1 Tax=Epichloe festucae (strain Fl1) TaxID=877507 RepID=A0A7S9KSA0_EPIFF|nr:hypothetical protein C2857_004235 [Epichloe festucae Fl1]